MFKQKILKLPYKNTTFINISKRFATSITPKPKLKNNKPETSNTSDLQVISPELKEELTKEILNLAELKTEELILKNKEVVLEEWTKRLEKKQNSLNSAFEELLNKSNNIESLVTSNNEDFEKILNENKNKLDKNIFENDILPTLLSSKEFLEEKNDLKDKLSGLKNELYDEIEKFKNDEDLVSKEWLNRKFKINNKKINRYIIVQLEEVFSKIIRIEQLQSRVFNMGNSIFSKMEEVGNKVFESELKIKNMKEDLEFLSKADEEKIEILDTITEAFNGLDEFIKSQDGLLEDKVKEIVKYRFMGIDNKFSMTGDHFSNLQKSLDKSEKKVDLSYKSVKSFKENTRKVLVMFGIFQFFLSLPVFSFLGYKVYNSYYKKKSLFQRILIHVKRLFYKIVNIVEFLLKFLLKLFWFFVSLVVGLFCLLYLFIKKLIELIFLPFTFLLKILLKRIVNS